MTLAAHFWKPMQQIGISFECRPWLRPWRPCSWPEVLKQDRWKPRSRECLCRLLRKGPFHREEASSGVRRPELNCPSRCRHLRRKFEDKLRRLFTKKHPWNSSAFLVLNLSKSRTKHRGALGIFNPDGGAQALLVSPPHGTKTTYIVALIVSETTTSGWTMAVG